MCTILCRFSPFCAAYSIPPSQLNNVHAVIYELYYTGLEKTVGLKKISIILLYI